MNKIRTALLSTALMSLSSQAFAEPVNYTIDTQGMHASINFKIQHLGYSWLTGRFNSFSGNYQYDADNLSNSKVSVKIDTKSVSTNHAERDKHLRSADFLNVSKFPESTFVSTAISGSNENMQVTGNFTLNGVTKPITIQAHKVGEGKDPWGGYRSGFTGTTEIKLADFNITKDLGPASANVLLELHIEGTKK
ncbi:MAG: YceI family protein [Thiomicrorhabdus sp.]|nr:YceI family protein [Thiomicrorhabdus sp.]